MCIDVCDFYYEIFDGDLTRIERSRLLVGLDVDDAGRLALGLLHLGHQMMLEPMHV